LKEGFSKFWGGKKQNSDTGKSGEEDGRRSATPDKDLDPAPKAGASDDDISGPDSRSEGKSINYVILNTLSCVNGLLVNSVSKDYISCVSVVFSS
jgi:hypothetical protein